MWLRSQCDTVLYDPTQMTWVADNWYQTSGSTEAWYNITQGNYQNAIDSAGFRIDAEAYFIKAVAFAKLSQSDSCEKYINLAYQSGISFSRFMLDLPSMDSLQVQPRYIELNDSLSIKVISHYVGYVGAKTATIWYRSATIDPIKFTLTGNVSRSITQYKDYGISGQVWFSNLDPDSDYSYSINVNDTVQGTGSFHTMPEGADTFSIAFGACTQYIPWRLSTIQQIDSANPIQIFLLGDNVYADNKENQEIRSILYQRIRSSCAYRNLIQNTSTLAIWDDHDFANNNQIGQAARFTPSWKYLNYLNFKDHFANPNYGKTERYPSLWFEHRIGEVDFFFLDGRYYMEVSDTSDKIAPYPSKLGKVQMRALQNWLSNSSADYKVIISPVEWTDYIPGVDAWGGYRAERDSLIFQYIIDNQINGVIFLGSDRHRSDHFKIDNHFGPTYDFEEFSSAALMAGAMTASNGSAVFSYDTKRSFGLLSFNTELADPEVTYRIINEDGIEVYNYSTKLSNMTF